MICDKKLAFPQMTILRAGNMGRTSGRYSRRWDLYSSCSDVVGSGIRRPDRVRGPALQTVPKTSCAPIRVSFLRITRCRSFFLAELPKGLTGKIDRRSLRDILIAQPDLLEQRVVLRV